MTFKKNNNVNSNCYSTGVPMFRLQNAVKVTMYMSNYGNINVWISCISLQNSTGP